MLKIGPHSTMLSLRENGQLRKIHLRKIYLDKIFVKSFPELVNKGKYQRFIQLPWS